MTNALAPTADAQVGQVIDRGALPVADVVSRVARIQQVMATLMKDGTHYGTIPGTPKPTLYQPGAELLCMTFRIAPAPRIEDLSTDDAIRYRLTMAAASQTSGEQLGEGVGECSSNEEKYRWRRPVCDQEWDEAAPDLRRERWMKGKNGATCKAKQIRTSPADIANTVLKMAYKRALISMTRTVLACSDIFAQDLEDLPEELREAIAGEAGETNGKPPMEKPRAKSEKAAESRKAESTPATGALRVATVERRAGETNGKPWTLYVLKMSDGRELITLDTTIGEAAERFAKSQAAVDVATEPGKKPGTTRVTEISRLAGDEA